MRIICYALLFAALLTIPQFGLAESTFGSGEGAAVSTHLPSLLQDKWADVFNALRADDLQLVESGVDELEQLKIQAGYEALEDYSMELLGQARVKLEGSEQFAANKYYELALLLSPHSPRVIAASLPIVRDLKGVRAALGTMVEALSWAKNYP